MALRRRFDVRREPLGGLCARRSSRSPTPRGPSRTRRRPPISSDGGPASDGAHRRSDRRARSVSLGAARRCCSARYATATRRGPGGYDSLAAGAEGPGVRRRLCILLVGDVRSNGSAARKPSITAATAGEPCTTALICDRSGRGDRSRRRSRPRNRCGREPGVGRPVVTRARHESPNRSPDQRHGRATDRGWCGAGRGGTW